MLKNDAFKSALIAAHLISADDPKKLGLCSVMLHFHDADKLRVVGCDGFQMVVCELSYPHGQSDQQFPISRADCRRLMKSLAPGQVCFPVMAGTDTLMVGDESFARIKYDYPDYQAALVQKHGAETNRAFVDSKILCDLISAMNKKYIRLEVHNEKSPVRIITDSMTAITMPWVD